MPACVCVIHLECAPLTIVLDLHASAVALSSAAPSFSLRHVSHSTSDDCSDITFWSFCFAVATRVLQDRYPSSSDPSYFKALISNPSASRRRPTLRSNGTHVTYSSAVFHFHQSSSPTPILQARPILMQERYSDLVDPRLKAAGYDPDEMNHFIKAAMLSIRSTATKRPKMTQVRDVRTGSKS
jgi:hypothetical protein